MKLSFVTQPSDSTARSDDAVVLEFDFETWRPVRLAANRMSGDDGNKKFIVSEPLSGWFAKSIYERVVSLFRDIQCFASRTNGKFAVRAPNKFKF